MKKLREITDESVRMEPAIADAMAKKLGLPRQSVNGKMVVNYAIKELYTRLVGKESI